MPRIVNDFSFHLDFIAVHSELPFVCSIITRVQYAVFFWALSRYSRINQCFVMLRSHIFETHSVYRPYYFDETLSIYSLQNEHNWSAVLSIIFKRYFYASCKIKNENLFECENIYWNNTVVAQDAYKRCIARHQLTLYNFHLFLCVFEPFIPCNARMLHEIDPHRFN